MKLVICDPNLERASGHHWFLDSAIASEAAARGVEVVLLANRSFTEASVGGARVLSAFSRTCYARLSRDPVTGAHDDFRQLNDLLYEELAAQPLDLFGVDTLVLFPTVTEKHLFGAVRWMKDFPAAQAPTFVVYLMMPSGIELEAEGEGENQAEGQAAPAFKVVNPLAALQYRLAFDLAAGPGAPVHFFGTGRSHAREFSLLAQKPISPHPVVLSGMSAPPAGQEAAAVAAASVEPLALTTAVQPPVGLLFLGDAKEDKGYTLLPALVERLAAQYPEWHWLLHANSERAWGACKAAQEALQSLAATCPNVELHGGFLSVEDYAALLSRASLVVAPYSPAEYWRKSSGVVWEAIWSGLPAVVPEGTWLDLELSLWGSEGERFGEWSAAGLESAISRLIPRLAQAQGIAVQASARFQKANTLRLLFNQLAEVWSRRLSLGALARVSPAVVLPLDKAGHTGWYLPEAHDGRQLRWSGRQIEFDVRLDADSSWRFHFEGSGMMDDAQVHQAVLTSSGRQVKMQATVSREQPRWQLQGMLGPSDKASDTTRLVLTLPFARRPQGNDNRELGLLFSAPLRFLRSAELGGHVTIDRPAVEFDLEQARREVLGGEVGYTLRGWAAATVGADPTQALEVVAEVDWSAEPEQWECFINGVAAVLRVAPLGLERKRVVWHVGAGALAGAGMRLSLLFRSDSEHPLTLFKAYAAPALIRWVEPEDATPATSAPGTAAADAERARLPAVPESGLIDFAAGQARPHLMQGWGHDEPDHVWMIARRAQMGFNLPRREGETIRLKLNLLTLGEIEERQGRLSVYVNTSLVASLMPRKRRRDFVVEFASELLSEEGNALVTFVAEMSGRPEGESRELAVSFFAIEAGVEASD